MILLKTKIPVFTSYPLRKPEIRESYSVNFPNFRFPVMERGKSSEKWLSAKQSQMTAEQSLFPIDRHQKALALYSNSGSAVPLRTHSPNFCNTLENFSYKRCPAVPDARNRAPRHSGAAFIKGVRTHEHATV
jgi:hypothetical protein